jgi:plastocyanin
MVAIAATLLLIITDGMSPVTARSAVAAPPTVVRIIEKSGNIYAFDPSTLTIKKGTQVVWTNASDAPHTVTSDTGIFSTSSDLLPKKNYTFTFNTAGGYTYHCNIHRYMRAEIIVTG